MTRKDAHAEEMLPRRLGAAFLDSLFGRASAADVSQGGSTASSRSGWPKSAAARRPTRPPPAWRRPATAAGAGTGTAASATS